MLDGVNDHEQRVAARLLEFLASGTPWHRALWDTGTVLALLEILEASYAVQRSTLRDTTLTALATARFKLLLDDAGVGPRARLQPLKKALSDKLRYKNMHYHTIEQLAKDIEQDYLTHWAIALRRSHGIPHPERAARAIATHLLDCGYDSNYLHKWFKYRFFHEPGLRTLPDILDEIHALAIAPLQQFDVAIAVNEPFNARIKERPQKWYEAHELRMWYKARNIPRTIQHLGGAVFDITARDPEAAARLAVERIDRFASRVSIATGHELRYSNQVWVVGSNNQQYLADATVRAREVNVRALHREKVMFSLAGDPDIDAALELLALMRERSPLTAVGSGWAAMEALISETSDRGTAAPRLAAIVACSWPRAELTLLSYALESDPTIGTQLRTTAENVDRCNLVANAILNGTTLTLPRYGDKCALDRMAKLLASPKDVLNDVRTYIEMAFRRVYRLRNLILHGGRTNAVALRMSLRTVTPLIGAGIDRIVHSYHVRNLSPLATAAGAEIALETIEGRPPLDCLSLLP